jgi:hypothetical protein
MYSSILGPLIKPVMVFQESVLLFCIDGFKFQVLNYRQGNVYEGGAVMSEKEQKGTQAEEKVTQTPIEVQQTDPCADIDDPVRRGLCRICQMPVVGESPFCKDHEAPVP